MEAEYNVFEIVKVTSGFRLFDAESYQRSYNTSHGNPLTPGYYIVSWPQALPSKGFNEYAAFHGPYENRQEAEGFLKAMYKHKYLLIPPPIFPASHIPGKASRVEMKVSSRAA